MAKIILALALAAQALVPTRTALKSTNVRANARSEMTMAADGGVVLIGVAADSGCGKSTFMRRLTGIFGGTNVGPLGGGFDNGGWETNTLVSDTTTVICLDDYHLNDRQGRKESGLTALNLAEQDFGACAIPTVETNPDPTRIALQRLRPRSRGPDRDS